MLAKQHANPLRCPCPSTYSPVAGKAGRNSVTSAAHRPVRHRRYYTAKQTGAMPMYSRSKTGAAKTETPATVSAGGPQGGLNLAQWLVNGVGAGNVTSTLQHTSQQFTEFWKDYRLDYYEKVVKPAKEKFDSNLAAAKKGNKELSDAQETFSQPVGRQVSATPAYADHPFIGEVVKYGEMVQAVYDTLQTTDVTSRFFGNCIAGALKPGTTLKDSNGKYVLVNAAAARYKVHEQMQADSGAYRLVVKEGRNYVGFIAEGPADSSKPDNGEIDIAVVFRGTITQDEWVQDAKAIQVRWNKGSAIAPYPRIYLRAFPFQPSTKAAISSFLVSLISLNLLESITTAAAAGSIPKIAKAAAAGAAPLASGISQGGFAQGLQSLLHAVLSVADAGVEGLVGLLGVISGPLLSAAGAAGATIGGLLERSLGASAATDALSFSLLVAANVWVVSGILKAIIAHPHHWLSDVQSLLLGVGPWSVWALRLLTDTLVSSVLAVRGDPLVSYGFKQMYADAKGTADQKTLDLLASGAVVNVGSAALPASPRLTILNTLADILEECEAQGSKGKKVRSITVTGHSLGGALASLCAYDLSTTIEEAATSPHGSFPAKISEATDLYSLTAAERGRFMNCIHRLKKKGQGNVPVVAAITFAAPRVGNAAYANAFKGRSLIDPLLVAEPLFNSNYNPSKVAQFGGVFRDYVWLLVKRMWFNAGQGDMKADSKELKSRGTVYGGMLRVVNVQDVVPDLPSAVRVPFYRYVHGGQELLLNSLYIPYYQAGDFAGASIGARHNLEQYLHTLNPTRCMALVNKSDACLRPEAHIPSSWWSPVPNRGMVQGASGMWERSDDMQPN